ncbi:MAG TPA: aminotransferase class V-fold PLP-dependent enzyme [Nitrososphaeraceae archaeon]|nr:aminotransferase class V-fold PLP-dependent enzyme [Nitrososphaeraceae archaeon]
MPSWDRIRDDFPVTEKYTYLSNAAISPIPKQVLEQSSKFYQELSEHGGAIWETWAEKMEQTRDIYAKFIQAHRDEVGFTHSTSEGMNIIAHMLSSKGSVISNELEFPSSTLPWLNRDVDVTFVRSKKGKILKEDIANSINQNTRTVVVSHVQYSTGWRQDLAELGELTSKKGLYLVVNPTQSLGAMYFNVQDFNIDFMASNGHKWILSSFGIGAIYIKKEYLEDLERFKPPFYSQLGQKQTEIFDNKKIDMSNTASRFELGSPHFSNILCLKSAIEYITKIGIEQIEKRILYLTEYLVEKLREFKVEIISPLEEEKGRSGIIVFKERNAQEIVRKLERRRIMVSARGDGIRVSPHFYNNENDIDRLVSELKYLI